MANYPAKDFRYKTIRTIRIVVQVGHLSRRVMEITVAIRFLPKQLCRQMCPPRESS